jgi:type I restriction enzyme S subunit
LAEIPVKSGIGAPANEDDPAWPRYIRITDIAGPRSLKPDTFKSLPPDEASQAPAHTGDILLAAVGATYGKSVLLPDLPGPACYAGYLVRFRAGRRAHARFVAYWTESGHYWHQLRSEVIQATIQNFSASRYQELVVPVPPVRTQRAIADFLDRETEKIDTLIEKKERLLDLLDEKRTALITQAVTRGLDPDVPMKDSGVEWLGEIPEHWEVTRVGHVANGITGFAFPSAEFDHDGRGIPLIRGDNVTTGRLRWGSRARHWSAGTAGLEKFVVQAEDVVVGMDGSKVGRNYALVTAEDVPALLVQRVTRLRPTEAVAGGYLLRSVSNPRFHAHVDTSKTDPAIPHITMRDILDFSIALPPKSEQHSILGRLDVMLGRLSASTDTTRRAMGLLHEYRTALISAAVTGQLDVTAEPAA